VNLLKTAIVSAGLLATLALGASNAQAYSFTVTTNYVDSTVLAVSDTVTVNVYIDATESGLQLLSASVNGEDSILDHVPTPANCGVSGPTAGCGSPTYILYSPAAGATGATLLYPQQNPFIRWTGIEPPNTEQININYAEAGLGFAQATGSGVWIASVVWHVADVGDGEADISVSLLNNGNIVRSNGINLDASQIPVNGVNGEWSFQVKTIPEPSLVALLGLGALGLGYAGRRRRSDD
jgi:hypothetical protein